VAVNETAWPKTEGFAEDLISVDVLALSTVWDSAADFEALNLAWLLYAPTIECEPGPAYVRLQPALPVEVSAA
jgi:hypothetical protein